MPLNKLENFIKNYEGRILYVNSNDLDATDSITNQGNSLTKPFKTIQRAILESARFSFIPGENNDRNDRTTILVYPGEHVIDNRPGFYIRKTGTSLAEVVSPSGAVTSPSSDALSLTLQSNFDLTQEDNILYKFNSVNGGVILPRGTSLIGLDLRKTKIRPKYVPNPTDSSVPSSSIFRITGNCFFWQFSLFDANQNELVYTDNKYFGYGTGNQSLPTFSHHKLTCFEYVDGVNTVDGYDLTDLDMYYAKLSNAFNEGSGRQVPAAQKYPLLPAGFGKERSEWEIVGAFATDAIQVTNIISGDGATPNSTVTVTTATPHNLTVDTPIKIRGVNSSDYNISTVVQSVSSTTTFTYLLQSVRNDLPADPGGNVTVTIDTDTVRGASPYIFNCSLRSVYGMNGMHADGSKASGFRSMVVAQFTAVSLQKDDRAFVKYDPISRTYSGIPITKQIGSQLSSSSASTNSNTVYHLDSQAVYRVGWESSHIKFSNDSFIQIVSVFAIGFNKHFDAQSGGDGSITNSNSNFGQFSLAAEGFKKEAFSKDNYAYITSVITPRSIVPTERQIDWISIDVGLTSSVGISSHLYLYGFRSIDNVPPSLVQGYRIGAKVDDLLHVDLPTGTTAKTKILMTNNTVGAGLSFIDGSNSSYKSYDVSLNTFAPNYDTILLSDYHKIQTGEKIIIISDVGDLPENISPNTVYYAIKDSTTQIKIASSYTNAVNNVPIKMYGGSNLKVFSRVSEKDSGELGSPIQWDSNNSNWFVHAEPSNDIYDAIQTLGVAGFTEPRTDVTYVKRIADNRSLDEKIYKLRIAIPKESPNARNPTEGFIIQESSKTGPVNTSEFTLNSITRDNFDYSKNPRFISTCTYLSGTVTVIAEKPHNLNVGDRVLIKNVKSSTSINGIGFTGYNGDFNVASVADNKTFTYSIVDNFNITHNVGIFSGSFSRDVNLPRFERNDWKSNIYIYRLETISPYIFNVQDGVYHAYGLKSDVAIKDHFTNYKYNQNVVDLYPQLDRDNLEDNPGSAISYATVSPLGNVVTSNLKKSITRETLDTFVKKVGIGLTIVDVSPISAGISTISFSIPHGLGGIVGYDTPQFGSGYTNGTKYNVRILNFDSTWNGATATVVVSAGSITSLKISDPGSGYIVGQTLLVEGFSGSTIDVSSATISSAVGNSLQITGLGTATDGLYRIVNVLKKDEIGIARTSGDPAIIPGQYAINVGPSAVTSNTQYSSTSGICTFIFTGAHGFVAGNKFRVVENSTSASNNLGDFIVKEVVGISTFTSITNKNISAGVRVLKHGFNSNDLNSSAGSENLGSRGISFYDNEYAILNQTVLTNTADIATFAISIPNSGISTLTRFPLGSYIQIDNEILRITTSTLSGSGGNEISAIRGYFGTSKENHISGSIIKKIKPIPIEIRRPSILRASGQTFEYLGYGPGNYSTGLPQVQVRTITEREDFLAQSQQKSGGIALYTGMNSNGDAFIGNTKTSASSGQQTTFAIPIPTVTGQDPSRLSVVFDEVIAKERILVEGGKSKQILSQFDGPVTFNQNIIVNNTQTKINGELISSSTVKLNNSTDSTSIITGSVISKGGFGIAKNVNIGGNVSIAGTATFNGEVQFNSGLVPDSFEDAYIGSSDKPWSEAWIAGIGIGTGGTSASNSDAPDRTIRSLNGNLILNSSTGITSVTDRLEVTLDLLTKRNTYLTGITTVQTGLVPNTNENSYLGTPSLAFSDAHIDEIRIGYSGGGIIDTRSGDLTLDSNTNFTNINDNVIISGQTFLTGITTVAIGLEPDSNEDSYLGTPSKSFSEAHIDEIRIGYSGGGIIDTRSGDLTLSSYTNQTIVDDDFTVKGTTTFEGLLTVNVGLVPDFDEDAYLGTSAKSFSEAYIDEIRIGVTGGGTIDTRSGDLTLDSFTGTTTINDNASISGTLYVNNTTTLNGELTVNAGIVPDFNEDAYLGSAAKSFSEAHIDEIRIGVAGGGTIDTRSGNLSLSSSGGNTTNTGTFTVTGSSTFQSDVTIQGSTKTFAVKTNAGTSKFTVASDTGNTVVQGTLGVTGATTLSNTLGVSGITNITNSTNSSSTSTGALLVTGGVGVGGKLYVGDNVRLTDVSSSVNSTSGALVVTGGVGIGGKLYVGNDVTATNFRGNADSATAVNVSSAGGTGYVLFATSTGNQTPKYNTGLSVSGTNLTVSGSVTAPNFIGNADSATTVNISSAGGSGYLLLSSSTGNQTPKYTTNLSTNGSSLTVSGNVNATSFVGSLTGNADTSTKVSIGGAGDTGNWYIPLVSNSGNQTPVIDAGLTYDASSNNLSVSGDITAFASDERLKTNIKPLENALEKVLSLSGFTYNFNEIGESLGFNTELTHVGVSAQQIQAVLPEAVAPAPANNDYLTVKYEKIVPLLIEAIKELADKVEKLEKKLN